MKPEANQTRQEIDDLKSKLRSAEGKLSQIVGSCKHTFGEIKYTPIVTEGYTSPGDPPGTMGIDWRGPCYVPGTTTKEWTRVCTTCGKVEKTRSTKTEYRSGPVAGTGGSVEVPSFG
jgi:hypothetical protein